MRMIDFAEWRRTEFSVRMRWRRHMPRPRPRGKGAARQRSLSTPGTIIKTPPLCSSRLYLFNNSMPAVEVIDNWLRLNSPTDRFSCQYSHSYQSKDDIYGPIRRGLIFGNPFLYISYIFSYIFDVLMNKLHTRGIFSLQTWSIGMQRCEYNKAEKSWQNSSLFG